MRAAADPEELLDGLLELDAGLVRRAYYGERSVFYNPGEAAPFGVIFASLKDRDGPNDSASGLSRPGVYRFAFQLSDEEYARRFGPVPARPPKGGVVELAGYDPARAGELAPHPVYAWMRWVQILAPTQAELEPLEPLLRESLEGVKAKWRARG